MNTTKQRLDGKTIVLTGGVGILGSLFSATFVEAGGTLVIVDLDEAACEAAAQDLAAKYDTPVHGFGVDVSDENSIKALMDKLDVQGLAPDVLVNAAATKSPNFFAPLEDFPLSDWNGVLDVNVTGVFLMIRALLPGMMERKSGNVINIGSIYGLLGPDNRIYEGSWYEDMGGAINTPMIYSASKGAVSAMTRYVATMFGGDGIRSNTLVPGGVFSGQNQTFEDKYSARVPLGRMGDKTEIASVLLFLASDASSYMNGQNVVVDGGLSAW